MNVLIDPYVFRGFLDGTDPDEHVLATRLEQLVRLFQLGILPVFNDPLWREFQQGVMAPILSMTPSPRIRTPMQFIRQRHRIVVPDSTRVVTAWGFEHMLRGCAPNDARWIDGYAALAAELGVKNERLMLFTSLIPGRNISRHGAGWSQIDVKDRWRLYVGGAGAPGIVHVPCISSVRNVYVPWTSRYDDALPDSAPNGGYHFLPPPGWHRGSTVSFRTVQGKVGWCDTNSACWVPPNTPGLPYHWDVFFKDLRLSPVGVSPANIVRWGAPQSEGYPGSVHHVPQHLKHVVGDGRGD